MSCALIPCTSPNPPSLTQRGKPSWEAESPLSGRARGHKQGTGRSVQMVDHDCHQSGQVKSMRNTVRNTVLALSHSIWVGVSLLFACFFSFITVADWSTQIIKNGREPKQLIDTVTLRHSTFFRSTSFRI